VPSPPFCFTDPTGRPLRPAPVHRELQDFFVPPTAGAGRTAARPRQERASLHPLALGSWAATRPCASAFVCAHRGAGGGARPVPARRHPRQRPAAAGVPVPAARPAVGGDALHHPPSGGGGRPERDGPRRRRRASTGARADLLVCDDIVDVKALRSRGRPRGGCGRGSRRTWSTCWSPTAGCGACSRPWHADDLNSHLKAPRRLRPVPPGGRRRPDAGLAGEVAARRKLAERRARKSARCRSRGAVPAGVRAGWRRADPGRLGALLDGSRPRPRWVVLAVDPAVSAKARADASALVTLGRTATNEVRCLEAVARRVTAPELVAAHRRRRPPLDAGRDPVSSRTPRSGPSATCWCGTPASGRRSRASRRHATRRRG